MIKLNFSQLNSYLIEQNFEYDRYDDFEDKEIEGSKYEKITTKHLDQGKGFYDLISSKSGILGDLPQNFVHNLKETHGDESDISRELDNITKDTGITILPGRVDMYSFVRQGDNLDEDKSYYVLTFFGKKDGIEGKHSITISHLGDIDIFPNTEITHLEESMEEKDIISSTNIKLNILEKEIREVIDSRGN